MKKSVSALMMLCLMLMLSACGGAGKMTMGTGGATGTYYGYGSILGQHIKNNTGIDVVVVSTDGSKANIQGVAAGDYRLGMVQSDVMSYAWQGNRSFQSDGKVNSFRVVAGLYAEAVQLVTMDPSIKRVADLAGRAVSVGAPGSGVYFNAMDVLAAAGLSEADIKPQYLSFGDSADGLKDGKIDAAFIVAGAPTPAITELCTTNSVYLVPIDGAVADNMMEQGAFYTAYSIPAGTYRGQEEDMQTVAVKATLIVSADAAEEDVYALTAAIFNNVQSIAAENGKGAELSVENATTGMAVPFHRGAAQYFDERGVTVDAD